jgi:hypothetical protein
MLNILLDPQGDGMCASDSMTANNPFDNIFHAGGQESLKYEKARTCRAVRMLFVERCQNILSKSFSSNVGLG